MENFCKDYEMTDGKGLICTPSGNHDISRIREHLDEEEIKIAFAFILSMPGAPFIYYGDEIGMKNLEGLDSVEGSEERTQCRTPMQWNGKVNAGFSTAGKEKLYAPIDPDYNRPTVEGQMKKTDSLWYEIQKLISLRKAHPALQSNPSIRFLYAKKEKYPFIYLRECENEKVLIVLNPKNEEVNCEIAEKMIIKSVIYSNHGEAKINGNKIVVPAASASFFEV